MSLACTYYLINIFSIAIVIKGAPYRSEIVILKTFESAYIFLDS